LGAGKIAFSYHAWSLTSEEKTIFSYIQHPQHCAAFSRMLHQ
jgi:hypothetical protein